MDEQKSIDPDDLPEPGKFKEKDIYQYKQPANSGKALEPAGEDPKVMPGRQGDKTSNMEGLNQAKHPGAVDSSMDLDADKDVDE